MNNTFGEKIRLCRKAFNLTQEELAKRLGSTKQVVSRYESGQRIPKISTVQQYEKALGVPASLLINPDISFQLWEHADMFEDYENASDNLRCELVREYGLDPRIAADYDSIKGLAAISNVLPLPAGRSYPLVGDIACGTPILAEENITEYVRFPGDYDADFCLRCRGDSMVDARILDGDIVLIRQQPEVANGEIAAVLIGEETTLKRVYRTGDTLTLMPANAAYPPMVYTGSQLSSVSILGKAVYFISPVK